MNKIRLKTRSRKMARALALMLCAAALPATAAETTAESAAPAAADLIPLDDISAYLNKFSHVQTEFTQISADGTISTGTIYISRPNRARFEYDPPAPGLVVVGRGYVAVYDNKSNTAPEMFPLGRTPLSIILADGVDLSEENMLVDHSADETSTTIVAQDPKHPDYGSIALRFTADPLTLRQWVITNDTGARTTVILGEVLTDVEMADTLFDVPDLGDNSGPSR